MAKKHSGNNILLIIGILSLLIFLFILIGVRYLGFTRTLDMPALTALLGIRSMFLVYLSVAMDGIFDTLPLICLTMAIAALLWFRKSKKESVLLVSAMTIGAALLFIIKLIVQRVRPENAMIEASGYSFPSGHTTSAVLLFGIVIYIAYKEKVKRFWLILSGSIAMVLLIAFSRIYLRVHWLTDVIAGIFLGIGLVLVSISIYEKIISR